MIIVGVVLYKAVILTYSFLMYFNEKTREQNIHHTGWINSIIIGVTDLVLIY